MTGFLYGHQGKRRKLKRAAGRIFRKMREMVIYALLVLIGLFLCSPVLLLLSGSITGDYELTQALKPALLEGSGFISWDFIPEFPTFASFRKLLFYSPQFFMLFWNSIKMVLLILAGQLLVSVPAAWAFAVYKFPFRKILFTLYIVLMLMPFQVTMLSSYLVLDRLHMLDTQGAVILPAIFSTFIPYLPGVPRCSSGSAGGGKNGWRGGTEAVCNDRTAPGFIGNSVRVRPGIFGILEYD